MCTCLRRSMQIRASGRTWVVLGIIILVVLGGWYSMNKRAVPLNKQGLAIPCTNCNIILISVDSLRADHMSSYGYARNTTPHFDTFSKRGYLFENYFSTSFLTPVSEMSVHTGLYPSAHGVTNFDTALPSSITTLTQYLKERDYSTRALFSSPEFTAGNPALEKSFSRGFDSYQYLDMKNNLVRQYPDQEQLQKELSTAKNGKLFLWLGLGGVHWPYGQGTKNIFANQAYNGYFKDKALDWEVFKNIYDKTVYPSKTKLTEEDMNYVVDQYDNGVRSFDDFFAIFLKELEAQNMLNNTIIIVQSEHGEDLGEHGYISHYDVYDTQTHTPLLVYVPNDTDGKRIRSFASSVDVFPSIIELLGGAAPESIQGTSLVPLLEGKETDGQRRVVFSEKSPLWEEAYKTIRADLEKKGIPVVSGIYKDLSIRTGEWRYILRLSKPRLEIVSWWKRLVPITIPEAELYNLKEDPEEKHNVIDQHPLVAQDLKKKLMEWYASISPKNPKDIEHSSEIQPYF